MPQPPRFGGASREAYTPAGAPHPSWRWAQVGPALCRTPLPVRCLRSKSVAPVDSIDIRYSQYSACDLIMIGLPKQFRSVWIYCSTPLCVPYDHKVWGYISVATVGVVCHSCELVSLIQFYVHTLWSYRKLLDLSTYRGRGCMLWFEHVIRTWCGRHSRSTRPCETQPL